MVAIIGATLLSASCSGVSNDVPSASSSIAPTVTSSPSPASIRGCVPVCSTSFADPGPIGPGPYTTVGFLDGQLTVTYPSEWVSHEDQGVEFSSAPRGKWNVPRVLFWDDIIPRVATLEDPTGHRVAGVPITVEGWLTWLGSNRAFSVSAPKPATIGTMELPASFVDISIAPEAANEDPYCETQLHTTCVALLSWPNSGENIYSWAAPGLIRLYLADVTYGGKRHLLAVAVEGHDAADFEEFMPTAEMVIASARAPIEPAS
jgi:hypothetical protein